MRELKKSSADLVSEARGRIEEIGADDLKAMIARGENILVVDIRDVRERQKLGFIPGSYHAPRGMLEFWVDPKSPYYREALDDGRKLVLHCAAGWRSALAAAALQDMGVEVAHVVGGFKAWTEAGGEVRMPEPKS